MQAELFSSGSSSTRSGALPSSHTRALYEIPFGVRERKPYYEVPVSSPERQGAPLYLAEEGGKGAWPALTWVAYGDGQGGMVLANRGTPSHRLMSGMIEVGVLRSPTTGHSGFSAPPAALENGSHLFEFALQPLEGDWRCSHAWELGPRFNAPPLVQVGQIGGEAEPPVSYLRLTAKSVALSAFKQAERGEGFVLRTFETEGRKAQGRLVTAFPLARVQELDLRERPVREVNPRELTWRPFEIKTLLLEPAPA